MDKNTYVLNGLSHLQSADFSWPKHFDEVISRGGEVLVISSATGARFFLTCNSLKQPIFDFLNDYYAFNPNKDVLTFKVSE